MPTPAAQSLTPPQSRAIPGVRGRCMIGAAGEGRNARPYGRDACYALGVPCISAGFLVFTRLSGGNANSGIVKRAPSLVSEKRRFFRTLSPKNFFARVRVRVRVGRAAAIGSERRCARKGALPPRAGLSGRALSHAPPYTAPMGVAHRKSGHRLHHGQGPGISVLRPPNNLRQAILGFRFNKLVSAHSFRPTRFGGNGTKRFGESFSDSSFQASWWTGTADVGRSYPGPA